MRVGCNMYGVGAQKGIKEYLLLGLIWIMAIYFFGVISNFSSQTATVSKESSSLIAEKAAVISSNLQTIITNDDISHEKYNINMYEKFHYLVRKGAHFLNFFILGFIYILLAYNTDNKKSLKTVLASLLCGLAAPIIDETHQWFVPGRSAEITDVMIDFSGVVTGCVIFSCLIKLKIVKGMV